MKIVALVAAKGDSERVRHKSIRPFADTDLTSLKLAQLTQVKGLDGIVLSSESDDVLSRVNTFSPVDIRLHKRDVTYATSEVSMSAVYRYLANEPILADADVIMWVPVTNPLVGPETYDAVIKAYLSLPKGFDCLLTMTEVNDYLFYFQKPVNFQAYPWIRSQHLHGLYSLNFAACMLRREDMALWGSLVGQHPFFYIDQKVDWHDIDDMDDFELCEIKYRRLGV